jgi:hypothetical protein
MFWIFSYPKTILKNAMTVLKISQFSSPTHINFYKNRAQNGEYLNSTFTRVVLNDVQNIQL